MLAVSGNPLFDVRFQDFLKDNVQFEQLFSEIIRSVIQSVPSPQLRNFVVKSTPNKLQG
jgi:hypothetical protein